MKLFRLICLLFLIGLLSFGCAKKSGIEGKVVDGKEQPIAGVKVIAMQVQPIKGYERFDTTTLSDGKFIFKRVYPASEYILIVEGALGEKILSGPEGQTSMLTSPIIVRFVISQDGVVSDSKTGLYWVQDAGQKATWFEANNYIHNLKIGGYSDWRLPSKEELKSLVSFFIAKGITAGINENLNVMGFRNVQAGDYWSSTTSADFTKEAWYREGFSRNSAEDAFLSTLTTYDAWVVDMNGGRLHSRNKDYNLYIWPVRAGE